jgi:hypothetical protein
LSERTGIKAHKVCRQEPADLVHEKIPIQSSRETEGDFLAGRAPISFLCVFAREVSLAEVCQSPQASD